MRRAESVLLVLRVLRRRRIATAAEIADEMGCSQGSVYRYIRDLETMGVPIEAERGVGYRLRDYDIPGWFTEDETSAILLGLGVIVEWGDPELADAARAALGKIGDALPKELVPTFEDPRFQAKRPWNAPTPKVDLAVIRRAIKEKGRVRIDYVAENGERTERVIAPLELRIYPPWVVTAWCESREDVRAFRVDRMERLERVLELKNETGSSPVAEGEYR